MAERKLIELELEVKEIIMQWDISISQVKTKVHIKEATKWINYQDSSSIRFPSLDPDTKVQMWVIYEEDLIGMANFELVDYMGQDMKNSETWVKLTSAPDGPFVFESDNAPKVRLGLSTKEFLLPSKASKPVPIVICEEFPGKSSKCPYLRKIAQAQMIEKQAEDNVYKIRESIGDLVGLSDDGPRSPGRSPTRSPTRVNCNNKKSGLEGTYLDELLEIQIPSRYNFQIDRLIDEEQRHMRSIVISLLHKTKVLQLQVEEIENVNQQIESNTASENDLTESMNETEEQLNAESAQVESITNLIVNEFSDIDAEIFKTENEINTLQLLIQSQTDTVEPLVSQNQELKFREADQPDEGTSRIEELIESFESAESQRETKQVELEKFIASNHKERNTKIEKIHNLLVEKEHLITQIQSAKNNIDRNHSESQHLQTELFQAEADLLLNNHLKHKFTIEQKLTEPNCTPFRDVLETLVAERCDQLEAQKHFEDFTQESTVELTEVISTCQQEVDKLQEELQEIEKKLPGMEANLNQLTVLVGDKLDIDSFLSSSKVSYENSLRDRDRILSELTYMGDYTLQHARTSLQGHRIKDKLKVLDVNKQLELNGMRKLVIDEKRKNPIYKPVQDDPIDIALYEFLNRNKVSVPFIREFSEVYLFGSRRIQLKLENEQLQVKVGGGYLPISEFVKTFQQAESDKIQGKIESPANPKSINRPSSRRSSGSNLSPVGKSSRPQSGTSTPGSRTKLNTRSKK